MSFHVISCHFMSFHVIILITFQVPKTDFKRVSSFTRSAILFGRFFSGLISQLLTSFEVLDYRGLNFVSFSSCCVALVFSIILPRVNSSIYFYKKDEIEENQEGKAAVKQLLLTI